MDELEQAHKAWEIERDRVILNLMKSVFLLDHNKHDFIIKSIKEAVDFIEKGEV